jgi:hypothetical protein
MAAVVAEGEGIRVQRKRALEAYLGILDSYLRRNTYILPTASMTGADAQFFEGLRLLPSEAAERWPHVARWWGLVQRHRIAAPAQRHILIGVPMVAASGATVVVVHNEQGESTWVPLRRGKPGATSQEKELIGPLAPPLM